MQVGYDQVNARLHDAQRPSRQHDALVVEPAHEYRCALAFFSEQVFHGYAAILEQYLARVRAAHAKFVEFLWRRESGHTSFNNKRAELAVLHIGDGIDDHRVRQRRICNPHFGSVQNVCIAIANRRCTHAHHVGTRACLTHCERAEMFPRYQFGQESCFLLCAAPAAQLIDTEI